MMTRQLPYVALLCSGLALTAPAAEAACRIDAGNARCVSAYGGNVDGSDMVREEVTSERGITTARFVSAPPRIRADARGVRHVPSRHRVSVPAEPSYAPGDVLPEDVTVLFNRERYDLPAPQEGWTYFRNGYEIFRADLATRVVIDRVNDHMSIRF